MRQQDEGKMQYSTYIASTSRAIPGSQIDAMHFVGKIFLHSQTFAPFLINHDKLSVDFWFMQNLKASPISIFQEFNAAERTSAAQYYGAANSR